jgi:hypothetical protein
VNHRGRSIAGQLAKGILGGQGDVGTAMGKLAGVASLRIGSGQLGALAVSANAAAAGAPLVINVTVQGSVISQRKLMDEIQKYFLRYGRRNPTTGLTY